jgi:hypothetical protein
MSLLSTKHLGGASATSFIVPYENLIVPPLLFLKCYYSFDYTVQVLDCVVIHMECSHI